MFRTALLRTSSAALANPTRIVNERIVVLGGGWGGYQIALNLNKEIPLTVVSPSNHFLFTPLLPSTAVGTLEFRCIQEPIRQAKQDVVRGMKMTLIMNYILN